MFWLKYVPILHIFGATWEEVKLFHLLPEKSISVGKVYNSKHLLNSWVSMHSMNKFCKFKSGKHFNKNTCKELFIPLLDNIVWKN